MDTNSTSTFSLTFLQHSNTEVIINGDETVVIVLRNISTPSREDWCKNDEICEESMIFGIIMCYAITNNLLYRTIELQLDISKLPGRCYAILLKFS